MALFKSQTDAYLQIQHTIEDYEPSLEVDATGIRVNACMKLVLLASELVTQKRLISMEGKGLYLEEPSTVSTNKTLLVSNYLQPN
jgi:hypothetical protein